MANDKPRQNSGLDQPDNAFSDTVSGIWHQIGMGKASYARLDREADQVAANLHSGKTLDQERDYLQDIFEKARKDGDADYLVKEINTKLARVGDKRRIHFEEGTGDDDKTKVGRIALVEPNGGTAYKELESFAYNRDVDKQAERLAKSLHLGLADSALGCLDDWIPSANTSLDLSRVWAELNEAHKNGTDTELFSRIKDHMARGAHGYTEDQKDDHNQYDNLRDWSGSVLKYNSATGELDFDRGNYPLKVAVPRDIADEASEAATKLHQTNLSAADKQAVTDMFLKEYAAGHDFEFTAAVNLELARKSDPHRVRFNPSRMKSDNPWMKPVPDVPRIEIFAPNQGHLTADHASHEEGSIPIDLKAMDAARAKYQAAWSKQNGRPYPAQFR